VLTLLCCVVGPFLPAKRLHTRLMIYGVDGATWDVIETVRPLQMLPELTRLEAGGAAGVLTSIEPMLSPIVWTTIASGQPLGSHGVAGFHVENTDCKVARIWDVLESEDMVVGTYKWLVTYPPREINGFMVPGWLATGPEVHPPDLAFARAFEQSRRARNRGKPSDNSVSPLVYAAQGARHGLRLSTLTSAARMSLQPAPPGEDVERMLQMQCLRATIDRDLFFGLLDRYDPDVATFTYYPTDAVAHRAWKYFQPDKFGGIKEEGRDLWDVIPATYRQADEILGELRARLPETAHIVLLSDHGMTAAGSEGGVAVYGLRAGEVDRVLKASGATVDVAQVGMKATVAVTEGSAVSVDDVRAQLRRFAIAGQPLFVIEDLSPGVFGLTLALDGDVKARAAESVSLPDGGTVKFETFLRMRDDYSGVHHEDAVIVLHGPSIQSGAELVDADLYDVAPTVLALVGLPASGEMVGRVLDEAFIEPPQLPEGPVSYRANPLKHPFLGGGAGDADGEEALQRMLEELGYVDRPGEAEPRPPGKPPTEPVPDPADPTEAPAANDGAEATP
jgi:predicted AlkP superfamily phosphohydrolase/phosphomutase